MKEKLHPGKILHDILIMEGSYLMVNGVIHMDCLVSDLNLRHIGREAIENLFNGKKDINHEIAYALGNHIKGTDMAFWLKLQEDYDNYQYKICGDKARHSFWQSQNLKDWEEAKSRLDEPEVLVVTLNGPMTKDD